MYPFVTKQLVDVPLKWMVKLFATTQLKFDQINDEEFLESLKAVSPGGIMLTLKDPKKEVSMEKVVVSAWKGNTTIVVMCNQLERQAYMYAIGQAYPDLDDGELKITQPNPFPPGKKQGQGASSMEVESKEESTATAEKAEDGAVSGTSANKGVPGDA
eukprot:CAMPEP_0167780090 /NCGR_PEP_ID=MMETSP0111_2-20121227/5162_1 /TAXON_ID=91324 /ORGANISM="Lotharella globosa, Strain CCCM811" /LENGTH=157 /DNA_ID=CAMNT_0007670559 /DNA_START=265 /DNA_END=738 /DNA_ORIENTATION=+